MRGFTNLSFLFICLFIECAAKKRGLLFQGEAVQQLREALKILAERVLILEHMIGIHGEEQEHTYSGRGR